MRAFTLGWLAGVATVAIGWSLLDVFTDVTCFIRF
jgi:hypothetical protein